MIVLRSEEAMKRGAEWAKRRVRLGLGQRELGDKIGVDASTVSGWETGKSQPLTKYLKPLADVLGYESVAALLENWRTVEDNRVRRIEQAVDQRVTTFETYSAHKLDTKPEEPVQVTLVQGGLKVTLEIPGRKLFDVAQALVDG